MSPRRQHQGGGPRGQGPKSTAGLGQHPSLPKSADCGDVPPLHSVVRAAESGSRRELLVALRDKLWTAFHDERTQPRDLSPLTLRLKEIQAEIEAIDLREDEADAGPVEDGIFDPESV